MLPYPDNMFIWSIARIPVQRDHAFTGESLVNRVSRPEMDSQELPTQESLPADRMYALLTIACGTGAGLIGLLGITGIFFWNQHLTPAGPAALQIPISAALTWLFLGGVLAFNAYRPLQRGIRLAVAAILGILAIVSALEFPYVLAGNPPIFKALPGQVVSMIPGYQITPLSPVAVGLIIPVSVIILALLYLPDLSGRHHDLRDLIGIMGIITSFISIVFIFSYIYQAPVFYGSSVSPIPILSACALFLIGFGLMTAVGPAAAPQAYLTGNSTKARLLRTFIPLTLIIILSTELLQIYFTAIIRPGSAIGLALIVLVFILLTAFVVGRISGSVSTEIDSAEQKREEAEEELKKTYSQLVAREEELRQKYEELLRAGFEISTNEKEYQSILRTAMDGFSIIDWKGGSFVDVNDALCRMLGYTREEMLHMSLHSIEARETREDIEGHIRKILERGYDRFQTKYRHREGWIIDVEVSVMYTGPQTGQFITFHRDITEQNTRENALEQAKTKLSLLNTVTFADIQNALFTLNGYQQLIRGKITDEQIVSLMEKEEVSVQKIADSLNFAKSYQDMGMKPPQWQRVSHVFLLAISHLDFLRIQHTMQLDDLEIFTDPLLEVVFLVLADNVLKHGGKATEISLTFQEADHQLTLVIEDNGTGIPENLKTTIFEREFQKKRGKGLFLAREILGITGMTIRETGVPGMGARFEILVPGNGYRFAGPQVQGNH
jgi:PAS domain S-box-containing protein